MNSLATQGPWSFVPRLQNEINRLFDDANQSDSSAATATWVPAVDIREYTDRFELHVDLPGVDPGKVDLTLEGGILTLSGQRTAPEVSKPHDEAQYTRSERGLGHFIDASYFRTPWMVKRSMQSERTASSRSALPNSPRRCGDSFESERDLTAWKA